MFLTQWKKYGIARTALAAWIIDENKCAVHHRCTTTLTDLNTGVTGVRVTTHHTKLIGYKTDLLVRGGMHDCTGFIRFFDVG